LNAVLKLIGIFGVVWLSINLSKEHCNVQNIFRIPDKEPNILIYLARSYSHHYSGVINFWTWSGIWLVA